MLKLVLRRLLAMIPLLLGVSFIAFLLVELMPGDPAQIIAGEEATPEFVAEIRHKMRLDESVFSRFAHQVAGYAQGDLGRSPKTDVPVWGLIEDVLPITLSLVLVGMVLALVLGVSAGTWAALRQGQLVDRAVTSGAAFFQAAPPFLVGLVLVITLAVDRSWFPASGYVPFAEDPWEWFRHLLLPGLTLGLAPASELARQTRAAMVDVFEQDFIRAARAKGLPGRLVIGKHVAKNAATPVVTVYGLQVGRIVSGAVVIELIFGLSGFAYLAYTAVAIRDIVLIQGVVLVSAVVMLVANLIVDLSYGYLNPKVRV
jgi:peptide/nickel transport system permease protein